LGSSTITINGDITIPATISVASSAANPVHTHITQIGSSGPSHRNSINFYNIISICYTVPSTSSDAFGRLRVSNPLTQFDSSQHIASDNNLKWSSLVVGTGSTVGFVTGITGTGFD
jgi:hypothetical protein